MKKKIGNLQSRVGRAALDGALVAEFLDREAEGIARFLADLRGARPEEEDGKMAAYFQLSAEAVQKCMSESGDFRHFISREARGGKER